MSLKKKLILGIIASLVILLGVVYTVKRTFFSSQPDYALGEMGQMMSEFPEGEMVYSLFSVNQQDPVTVDGSVALKSDSAYFYNPELGEIQSVLVKDGQQVTKGTVLFNYQSTDKENQYTLEDLSREQTKLYNQREQLIEDLAKLTGAYYNYQGDRIATYWGADGKQAYEVIEAIGKNNQVSNNTDETSNLGVEGEEGIKQQIRTVNEQIEEVEIKIIRQQEKQNNKIIAKMDGIVHIDETGMNSNAVPLVRIVSQDETVVGSVTEYDFYALAQDREVSIYLPAENRTVGGKIVYFDTIPAYQNAGGTSANEGGIQPGSASTSAKFNFVVEPYEKLQPGFSAKINITLPGLVIPSSSVLEDESGQYVFKYVNGKAVKTQVELLQQGLQQVVLRGLEAGDQLIDSPFDLTDGQEVNVLDPNAFIEPGAFEEGKG